jgi:hypothetical protein
MRGCGRMSRGQKGRQTAPSEERVHAHDLPRERVYKERRMDARLRCPADH